MMNIKLELAGKIGSLIGMERQEIVRFMEVPPNPEMGDLSLPIMRIIYWWKIGTCASHSLSWFTVFASH